MNELAQKQAKYLVTWRNEQGLPPPPDRFKAGDPIIIHLGKRPDRHGEFVGYGVFRGGKQMVFIWFTDTEDMYVTIEDEIEHCVEHA
jgi:hypothetical protein